MTYSLNVSQPVSNSPRKKRTTRVAPCWLDRILVFAEHHYSIHGQAPTKRETSIGIGYNYQGVCQGWKMLAAAKRLPDHLLVEPVLERKATNKAATNHLKSGDTTPETAAKLWRLLKTDRWALVLLYEMAQGKLRGDL